jgi:hypothetical protein
MNTFKQFESLKPFNPLLSPPPRARGRREPEVRAIETSETV